MLSALSISDLFVLATLAEKEIQVFWIKIKGGKEADMVVFQGSQKNTAVYNIPSDL